MTPNPPKTASELLDEENEAVRHFQKQCELFPHAMAAAAATFGEPLPTTSPQVHRDQVIQEAWELAGDMVGRLDFEAKAATEAISPHVKLRCKRQREEHANRGRGANDG
jgi:hypothetical protein